MASAQLAAPSLYLGGVVDVEGEWSLPAGTTLYAASDLCIRAETIHVAGRIVPLHANANGASVLLSAKKDLVFAGAFMGANGQDAAPTTGPRGDNGGDGSSLVLMADRLSLLPRSLIQAGAGGAAASATPTSVEPGTEVRGGDGGNAGRIWLVGGITQLPALGSMSLLGANGGTAGIAVLPPGFGGSARGGDGGDGTRVIAIDTNLGTAIQRDSLRTSIQQNAPPTLSCETLPAPTTTQAEQECSQNLNVGDIVGRLDLSGVNCIRDNVLEIVTELACKGDDGAPGYANGLKGTDGTDGTGGGSGPVFGGVGGPGGGGSNGAAGETATGGDGGKGGCFVGTGGKGGDAQALGGAGGIGGKGGTGGPGNVIGGTGGNGGDGGNGAAGGTAKPGRGGCGAVFAADGPPGKGEVGPGAGGVAGAGGEGGSGLIPGAPGAPGQPGQPSSSQGTVQPAVGCAG